MLTAAYLLLATLSMLAFYLATSHQRFVARLPLPARMLRVLGGVLLLVAGAAAIVELGTWAGVFASLSATMFAAVLLPYVDAWRQRRVAPSRGARSRVG